FGVVESVKSVSELFAPISGEVADVNESLFKTPEKINDDPYGQGWMLRVKLSAKDDVNALLDAAKYKATIGE
ncbi:MAG TPA: glycine cleavage system protein H, partial [Candidatus Thermoplasmatota archaeon]